MAILPGQYFDAETGLHQNWHRDYDPSIGRYLQSDPIGLQGGLSTYGYALQDPLTFIDPSGLEWQCTCKSDEDGGGYNHPDYRLATGKNCTYECKCGCANGTLDFVKRFYFPTRVTVSTTTDRFGSGVDAGSRICHGQNGVKRADDGTDAFLPVFDEFTLTDRSDAYRQQYPDVFRELDKAFGSKCCE